jgi:hypothetical protein
MDDFSKLVLGINRLSAALGAAVAPRTDPVPAAIKAEAAKTSINFADVWLTMTFAERMEWLDQADSYFLWPKGQKVHDFEGKNVAPQSKCME